MNFLGSEQFGNHSSFAVMLFTLILTIDLVDSLTHVALRSVCASCVSRLFRKMLDLTFFLLLFSFIAPFWLLYEKQGAFLTNLTRMSRIKAAMGRTGFLSSWSRHQIVVILCSQKYISSSFSYSIIEITIFTFVICMDCIVNVIFRVINSDLIYLLPGWMGEWWDPWRSCMSWGHRGSWSERNSWCRSLFPVRGTILLFQMLCYHQMKNIHLIV